MDSVKPSAELLARLEFLRSVDCAECGSRSQLFEIGGAHYCWACYRAAERRRADAALPGHAPVGKVR